MRRVAKTFKLVSSIAKELEETAKREGRAQTTILTRALTDYFAKSKATSADNAETPQPEQQPA
jgi:predicted transcriptional regulator